tara:strand:+ start:778 stop:981 length:204 start_codon:yes stop_codon:yes gene_type:complete
MDFTVLLEDVIGKLPEDKRQVMDEIIAEYSANDNLRFLLALTTGANKRERQLLRLLIKELEKLELGL